MKKTYLICILLSSLISCNSETPTQFTEEALNDTFISLDGEKLAFRNIIASYKGQTVLIDVWASWCKDCIQGMPIVKGMQTEFPDVAYLFLSEDRSQKAWKRGIEKYEVVGDHYYMEAGHDGPFADFLNSNWIPRYMVIDPEGSIKLFKAKKATDERIKTALQ